MHKLKNMKETLVGIAECALANAEHTDTKELGEVVDMIKDLEEAMYYCSIVKAMEEKEQDHCHLIRYPVYERDMDKDHGRMYYTEPRYPRTSYPDYMDYEKEVPMVRDSREGRSPISRRNYMESKALHQGKEKKIKELEQYMKELSEDIVEMIEDASPEERQMLEKKMTHLTSKIAQINSNA